MPQLIIAFHVRVKGPQQITLDRQELEAYKMVPSNEIKGWKFGTGLAVHEFVKRKNAKKAGRSKL